MGCRQFVGDVVPSAKVVARVCRYIQVTQASARVAGTSLEGGGQHLPAWFHGVSGHLGVLVCCTLKFHQPESLGNKPVTLLQRLLPHLVLPAPRGAAACCDSGPTSLTWQLICNATPDRRMVLF
jgi:hypothetical protein